MNQELKTALHDLVNLLSVETTSASINWEKDKTNYSVSCNRVGGSWTLYASSYPVSTSDTTPPPMPVLQDLPLAVPFTPAEKSDGPF